MGEAGVNSVAPTRQRVSAVDIGRHRLFVSTTEQPDPTGVVTRWLAGPRTLRFSDYLIELVADDPPGADAVVADIKALVEPLILDHAPLKVAIPAGFGPRCRQTVVRGLVELGVRPTDLVERPVAAAAGWLAHRNQLGAAETGAPVLVIDNDGGEVSVAALDPPTKRLLLAVPLSTGPDDDPMDVVERLREVVAETARLTHRASVVRQTDWATVSSVIAQVIVTGSGARSRALARIIETVLPAAHVMPDPVSPSDTCVVTGLAHLDQLDDWSASWPTTAITSGEDVLVEAGPAIGREHERTELTPGSTLQFEGMTVCAGSMIGDGLILPGDLGPDPILQLLTDGRILVLAGPGIPPLGLAITWPCPGTTAGSIGVHTVGRRAVALSNAAPAPAPVPDEPTL